MRWPLLDSLHQLPDSPLHVGEQEGVGDWSGTVEEGSRGRWIDEAPAREDGGGYKGQAQFLRQPVGSSPGKGGDIPRDVI